MTFSTNTAKSWRGVVPFHGFSASAATRLAPDLNGDVAADVRRGEDDLLDVVAPVVREGLVVIGA
jgi:hypothetical protein